MRKDGGLVASRSNLSSQAERQAISKEGKQFFSSTNLNLMKPLKESSHKAPPPNLAARGGGGGSGSGGGARGGSRRPPDYILSASSVAVAGGLAAFALYDREEYSTFDLFAKADRAKNVLDERGYP